MRVLVTGSNGQLGHDVCKHLREKGLYNVGVDIQDFDLTNHQATFDAITTLRPDTIVHCAAYTAVDKAESCPDLCQAVNVDGTRNIALAAKQLDAKVIYISTDYVFNGEDSNPYEVDAHTTPMNVYGLSKARGEEEIRKLLHKYFIVRTSWAFGMNGNNFVKTIMRLGAQRDQIQVVSDQVGSPTYTDDLAVLLCDMLETERYGVYHATNQGFCSWYEFAQQIIAEAGMTCKVTPILACDYTVTAKRPMNSRLSSKSLDDAGFDRLPPWQDAVKRYIKLIKNHL